MKKIIYITIATFFILGSCKKNPLDITPDGRITLDEVFSDELLATSYLNTIYSNLQPYGTAYDYWTMLAGKSDEAHDNDYPQDAGRSAARWYNGELRPNWNPLDIQSIQGIYNNNTNGRYYEKAWAGIRQTNVFLERLGATPFQNEDTKLRVIAEAKTLRAFFYLELIKMYGGMPVVDKPFSENFKFGDLARQSFKECVDFIKKNCDEAIQESKFPWRISTEPERGRFTKAVAHSIKSQALLFAASALWNPENEQGRWQVAADQSKESLEDLIAAGYQLFSDYESYFFGRTDLSPAPSDRETIYEIKPNQTHEFSNLMFLEHAIPLLGGEKAGCSPSQELVDAYEMANGEAPILGYTDGDHLKPIINTSSGYNEDKPYEGRDPRFYATVWYNNAFYGSQNGNDYYIESYLGGRDGLSDIMQRTGNGYYLRKFKNPAQLAIENGSARFKKYRLGEIFLNYAEAANEFYGPTDQVRAAVNAVRRRAHMPDLKTGLNKEQMREHIRNERRVELAFEEHRFWDVRRWKIIDQTDRLTTGMEWTKEAPNQFRQRRIVADRRKTFTENYLIIPIPEKEMNIMPHWQQNPGW